VTGPSCFATLATGEVNSRNGATRNRPCGVWKECGWHMPGVWGGEIIASGMVLDFRIVQLAKATVLSGCQLGRFV